MTLLKCDTALKCDTGEGGDMSAKKDLLVWSGGLDSTAILLDHIRRGVPVDTAYVSAENNEDKTEAERRTRNLIRVLIEAKHRPGAFDGIQDHMLYHGRIHNRGDLAHCWQPGMWLTALVHGYMSYWDYGKVLFGYIQGDSLWHYRHEFESFYESLKRLYAPVSLKMPDFKWPQIDYPLEWCSKADVISRYFLVDDMGKDVLGHIWTCEIPRKGETGAWVQCGTCETCRALYLAKLSLENKGEDVGVMGISEDLRIADDVEGTEY